MKIWNPLPLPLTIADSLNYHVVFSICHHSRAGARDASEASRSIGMFFINMILFILLIHFYYSILELSTTTTTSSHINMSVHSHLNGLHLTSTRPTSTTNGHLNTSSHSSARGNFFYFCFFLISLITASYRIYMNHYLHSTPTGKKGQRQHRHDNGEWGAWQGRAGIMVAREASSHCGRFTFSLCPGSDLYGR